MILLKWVRSNAFYQSINVGREFFVKRLAIFMVVVGTRLGTNLILIQTQLKLKFNYYRIKFGTTSFPCSSTPFDKLIILLIDLIQTHYWKLSMKLLEWKVSFRKEVPSIKKFRFNSIKVEPMYYQPTSIFIMVIYKIPTCTGLLRM